MMRRVTTVSGILLLLLAVASCGRDEPEEVAAEAPVPEAAPPTVEPTEPAADSQLVQSELAGTDWKLVKIMSMDDTESVPDDGMKYRLTFGDDGRVMVVADCNRGTGSYTSQSAGQLTFGPIATTKMACPEGSIDGIFLAQFEWVRSYVLENGNLYLATMADGSIIEFEPVDEE